MAMRTLRHLPDEMHRALRMQAEVRKIVATALKPEARIRLGKALAALSRDIGLTNEAMKPEPRPTALRIQRGRAR